MEEAAKSQATQPTKEVPAAKATPPVEKQAKPTNCAKCNKPLKKKIWYYRNGKHYCTKTCWRSSLKSEKTAAPAS